MVAEARRVLEDSSQEAVGEGGDWGGNRKRAAESSGCLDACLAGSNPGVCLEGVWLASWSAGERPEREISSYVSAA